MRYLIPLATLFVTAATIEVSAQVAAPSASRPAPAASVSAGGRTSTGPVLFPGTRASAFSIIQGEVLNSSNRKVANAALRLRDARSGRITATTTSDASGAWLFARVDPGSYVVEMIAGDQTVLAATPIINVDAGDSVSSIVKLPFRLPPYGGAMGRSVPSVTAISIAAGAAGVLATAVTGEPISPPQ